MPNHEKFRFKVATEDWEFEQIHRLNYKTFVKEIPQHNGNSSEILIDPFHDQNTYFIATKGRKLAGMIATRDRRPFSLDYKLENLEKYLPPNRNIVEIRLLSIEPEYRKTVILQGLIALLTEHSLERNYNLAIISGILSQAKLYKHIGFTPFGPVVGTGKALFQPMYITLEKFADNYNSYAPPINKLKLNDKIVNLLPGPVAMHQKVRKAFESTPVSHRKTEFVECVSEVKARLCSLTKARYVEILVGSGTLANDAVAAQLKLLKGSGLILSNGEFGERLVDHAKRWQLAIKIYRIKWGAHFSKHNIQKLIQSQNNLSWVWMTHCETSSGVLNDIEFVKSLCRKNGIKLCLDCISSLASVPLDLRGVYLASGTSGKAIGSYAGLAFAFYNQKLKPKPKNIPRYLDLGYYNVKKGVPFTFSSNLLFALREALLNIDHTSIGKTETLVSETLRSKLIDFGFKLVGTGGILSPSVITIELPAEISSVDAGSRMAERGFLISYLSSYLVKRNWIQICLMGKISADLVERFPLELSKTVRLLKRRITVNQDRPSVRKG